MFRIFSFRLWLLVLLLLWMLSAKYHADKVVAAAAALQLRCSHGPNLLHDPDPKCWPVLAQVSCRRISLLNAC